MYKTMVASIGITALQLWKAINCLYDCDFNFNYIAQA